jgi:hypothetical protein
VLLPGRCAPDANVPSSALGDNPQGKYMGGEEGMGHVYGYWPILVDAGGSNATNLGCTDELPCDFLYRDYAPNGNRNGQFGILRVAEAATPPAECDGPNELPTAEANGPYRKRLRRGEAAVEFSSAGSVDTDGDIVSYVWTFGDPKGGTSNEPNPTYTYEDTGTFTATLTVTDNCGGEGSDTAQVTIR